MLNAFDPRTLREGDEISFRWSFTPPSDPNPGLPKLHVYKGYACVCSFVLSAEEAKQAKKFWSRVSIHHGGEK